MATEDLQPTITAGRRAFSDVLKALPEADWNAPSLCAGWRTREVVAHMTMLLIGPDSELTRPLGRAFSCIVIESAIAPDASALSSRTFA